MLVPGRRAVAVQALGQLLVDVDHQRVFLRRVEVVGLGQDRAQRLAVGVDVLDELGLAPDVLALLRVGVRDLLHVAEAGVAHPEVRELLEPRLREHDTSAFLALMHRPEGLVHHHDLLGRGGGRRRRRGRSRCLGLVVVGRKQNGLVGRDRALFRVERSVAEDDLFFRPSPAVSMRGAVPSGLISQMSYWS